MSGLTDDNRKARKGLISASNIGSLVTRWRDKTIIEIAKERAGIPVPDFPTNEAMQRGIDHEVDALNCFNRTRAEEVGMSFVHNDKFIKTDIGGVVCGGTPDALAEDHHTLEIKTPMPENFPIQRENPPYRYFLQSIMQRMIMQKVTGERRDKSYLFIYSPEDDAGELFTIPRDNKRMVIIRDAIIAAEADIVALVEKYKNEKLAGKTPPPMERE